MSTYKRCSCGFSYSKKEWEKLQFIGVQTTQEEMYGPGAVGWPCCPSCGGV